MNIFGSWQPFSKNKLQVTRQTILIIALLMLVTINTAMGQRRRYILTEESTYFPFELYKREIFNGQEEIDSITLRYHSQYLSLLKEPKLFNSKNTTTIFRFTWLRSFHPAMVITLSVINNKINLETKYANKVNVDNSYFDLEGFDSKDRDRFEQYSTGKIDSISISDLFQKGILKKDTIKFRFDIRNKRITTQEFEGFKKLIYSRGFWNYPTMKKYDMGTDGAEWILEGLSPEDGYHMVYRWSPDKNHDYDFRQICEYLITLTGTVKKRDVY